MGRGRGAHLDLLADLEDLLNRGDAVVGDLGDVQQPVHVVAQVYKRAVRLQGRHLSLNHLAHLQLYPANARVSRTA